MSGRNYDGWLLFVGVLHPIVMCGSLVACGSPMGIFAFHPAVIPATTAALVGVIVSLRLNGIRISWWAVMTVFGWWVVVVGVYLFLFQAAASAV